MRISDWSSDVCSSDLSIDFRKGFHVQHQAIDGPHAQPLATPHRLPGPGSPVLAAHVHATAVLEILQGDGFEADHLPYPRHHRPLARTRRQTRSEWPRVGEECVSKC